MELLQLEHGSSVRHKFPKDTLKSYGLGCSKSQCHAATMEKSNGERFDPDRSPEQIESEASEFLSGYYKSILGEGEQAEVEFNKRFRQISRQIHTQGYYVHTKEELEHGVRTAWRNSSRCIMRAQFKNIEVIDARNTFIDSETDELQAGQISSQEIFEGAVRHLKSAATSNGSPQSPKYLVNSLMTVFPQLLPGEAVGCRIWNSQLVRYAGYEQSDGSVLGDPANVEITKVCLGMGWYKPREERTAFDILPLITQAPGHPPFLDTLPDDAVLTVPLTHSMYPELERLKIQWHAIPAISDFVLDIGGIQYPCAPFNGWYMCTEIMRNLTDVQRYNLLPTIARKVLNLEPSVLLWKDKALVEVTTAIMQSFEKAGVTIVDHHTASKSFMRFHEQEVKGRGFCPADWVWIVPPLSGSGCPVFHQEMINIFVKPNFLPGLPLSVICENNPEPRQIPTPESISSSFLPVSLVEEESIQEVYSTDITNRIRILYATETGTSLTFATLLHSYLSSSKKKKDVITLHSMSSIDDISMLKNDVRTSENARYYLLIVTSTFGNGGPPQAAQSLYNQLRTLLSLTHEIGESGMLTGVEFGVFGCCSSDYAQFNACAKFFDQVLLRLGGERIVKLGIGDAKSGDQEGIFQDWMKSVIEIINNNLTFSPRASLSPSCLNLELILSDKKMPQNECIQSYSTFRLIDSSVLYKQTRLVSWLSAENLSRTVRKFSFALSGQQEEYKEGGHLLVLPHNRIQEIRRISKYIKASLDMYITIVGDGSFQAPEFLLGSETIRDILTRWIDLEAKPVLAQIHGFVQATMEVPHSEVLREALAKMLVNYRDWITEKQPTQVHLCEVLQEHGFSPMPMAFLKPFLSFAPRLQPRSYSISSSPARQPNTIDITVGHHTFKRNGNTQAGLCSQYLWNLTDQTAKKGKEINVFARLSSSSDFEVPHDLGSNPIILIANGTGISPFRSFWQRWEGSSHLGSRFLYYGCRSPSEYLYSDELEGLEKRGILKTRVIFSRFKRGRSSRGYVQRLLNQHREEIVLLINKNTRIYLCGSLEMKRQTEVVLDEISPNWRDLCVYRSEIF